MIYRGKIPGYSGGPLWYQASSGSGHDMFRRVYMLNRVRPVTRWRKVRAFIGWHERDTLRSGFTNKPVLNKGAVHFDGTQKMRTRPQ